MRIFDSVAGAAANLARTSPAPEVEHAKSARLDAPFRRVPFPLARFAAVHADEGAREEAMLESAALAADSNASPQAAATPPSGYVAATFDLFDPQPTLASALPVTSRDVPQPPARLAARTTAAPLSVQQPNNVPAAMPLQLADADATAALPPVATRRRRLRG